MVHLVLLLIGCVLVALGFTAGFYLSVVPVIILSVFGVAFFLYWLREMRGAPRGTSGGLACALMMLAALFFLIPLWIGAVNGYGELPLPSISDAWSWLCRYLLR